MIPNADHVRPMITSFRSGQQKIKVRII
jgi:hypothetical protein